MEYISTCSKFITPYFSSLGGGMIGKKCAEIILSRNISIVEQARKYVRSDAVEGVAAICGIGPLFGVWGYFIYEKCTEDGSAKPRYIKNVAVYSILPTLAMAVACFATNLLSVE